MTVDEYIDAAEAERRDDLRALRRLVLEAAPDAEESIRYGMPYYERGGPLCAFAAQKRYLSFYLGHEVVDRHRDGLGALKVGKGCIRFRRVADAPIATLTTMVQEVARERAGG